MLHEQNVSFFKAPSYMTVPSLLESSRLGFLPRYGFLWLLRPASHYGPGEWLHPAPWAVPFLWICPWAVAFSPLHSQALRQASGRGPILLALPIGVTLSRRTVGCQSSSPLMLFSGHWRSGNVRPVTVSFSQNSFIGTEPSIRGLILT